MIQLKQTSTLLAALLLAGSVASVPVTAQGAKPAGSIKCTLTVSVELAVGARRPVLCVYQPAKANKPAVPLELVIEHYAAPVRLMKQVDLSWEVYGSDKAPAKRLAGSYEGDMAKAKQADEANALNSGGEFELMPVKHDDPDVYNLARGIATATVKLR